MAKLAREELFSPDEIACVHVMNRAVRQCFLMGDDPVTGKNFDHRKQWLEKKLELHAACFGIDLLGYAILSNHFHLVLRSRPDVVKTWDDAEVARRWFLLCPQRKHPDGSAKEPTQAEINSIATDPDRLREIRRRLSDFSWWMRLLCQYVGQRANRESGEAGRFWQDRFRAVRLLDESAVLACVAYVDLNPIRAKLADTIEGSDFTSAKQRLEALLLESQSQVSSAAGSTKPVPTSPDRSLSPVHCEERQSAVGPCPSASEFRASDKGFLNMTALEYLQFLDWTARHVVPGKAGSTPSAAPELLQRVGLQPEVWLGLVRDFGRLFHHVAGQPHEIARARSRRRKARFRVRRQLQAVFSASA